MKNNLILKKIICCFMTFIMVFGIFHVIRPKQVQAATYPLKVHYLDVKGDATLIKYTYNGQTHYGMIDAGQETENNRASESAAGYFASIADKAKNPRTLDFCIITHAHNDHYIGLKYFEDYNIKVKNMYVNSYYNDISYNGKVSLKTRLNSMKKNGSIENIEYIGYRQTKQISIEGGFLLTILGPVLNETSYTTENPPGAGVVNIRSMMCTLDYDNYKYIFMGDLYQKDGKGLSTITNNNLYQNYLIPKANKIVIYKISHHGRRNENNYNEEAKNAELDMYNYVSNNGKNQVYCIANRYYTKSNSSTSDYNKFGESSTDLQNLWYNKTKNVYFNTGYKKSSTTYSTVSRDTINIINTTNKISALTSTTSLGFN